MMGSSEQVAPHVVTFTYCKNFATAETKSATWPSFAATVSKSVGYDTKEESIKRAMVVGGVRDDEDRGRAENVNTREILALDYDDFAGAGVVTTLGSHSKFIFLIQTRTYFSVKLQNQ